MHFVGTSLLGSNTSALRPSCNRVDGIDIDDAKPGSSQMSVLALRNYSSLLRSRNGSLEQAFNVLDADSTGKLTLKIFTQGMERFGSSPEDARSLFQQMDVSGTGYVALPAFLAALRDDTEFLRSPSLQESAEMTSRISRLEAQVLEMAANKATSDRLSLLEAQVIEMSVNKAVPERLTLLESQVDSMALQKNMPEHITRLSGEMGAMRKALTEERMARDSQDQALIAECESIKLQNAVQLRAVSQNTASAVIAELQAKLEVLRVQLEARVQDLTVAQVQGEMASLKGSAEGFVQLAERLEARCEAQCKAQLDALKQRLESHMQDMLAEWRAEVQSESMANAKQNRELERMIVERAIAEAHSTVLSVTKDFFNKEDGENMRTETIQYAERFAVAEDHIKMLRMEVDRIRTLFSSGTGTQQGAEAARAAGVEAKDVEGSAEAASVDGRISETVNAQISESAVRLENQIMSVSQNVQQVSSSIRAEVGDLRAEIRRLSSVDVHNLIGDLAKLQTQKDDDRKQVDSLSKQHSEAWQKEAELRALEDKRVEGKLVEQIGNEMGSILLKVDRLGDDIKAQAATLSDFSRGVRANLGLPPPAPRQAIPKVLQERLEGIIKKLDSKCIEDLAPDLKQLRVLLADEEQDSTHIGSEHGESNSTPSATMKSDDVSGKFAAERRAPESTAQAKGGAGKGGMSNVDVAMRLSATEIQAQVQPALAPVRDTSLSRVGRPDVDEEERMGDGPKSVEAMRRMREDILSYLHVEFQEILSSTLKKSWPSPQESPLGSGSVVVGDPQHSSSLAFPVASQAHPGGSLSMPIGQAGHPGGSLSMPIGQTMQTVSPQDPRNPSTGHSTGVQRQTSPPQQARGMVNPGSREASRDHSHSQEQRNSYAEQPMQTSPGSVNIVSRGGRLMELPMPHESAVRGGSLQLSAHDSPSMGQATSGAAPARPSPSLNQNWRGPAMPTSPLPIPTRAAASSLDPAYARSGTNSTAPPTLSSLNRCSSSPINLHVATGASSVPGTRAPSASITATQWRAPSMGVYSN